MSKDWRDLGDTLESIVENAVHKKKFGHLNDSITEILEKSIDRLWSKAGWSSAENPAEGSGAGGEAAKKSDGSAAASARTASAGGGDAAGTDEGLFSISAASGPERYFAGQAQRKGGAWGKIVGGILLLALGLVSFLVAGAMTTWMEFDSWVWIPPAATSLLGIVMVRKGIGRLELSKSFEAYRALLGDKTFVDIKTLADYSHKKEEAVRKEVKKMLSCKWFRQGHLDHAESCLMVTHKVYGQYLETMRNQRQRAAAGSQDVPGDSGRGVPGDSGKKQKLSAEAQAVIDKGRQYIRQIRRSNDNIPGLEVSEKMSRMEHLVERIFQQVESHPENIGDLRKLMDYYLPMTMKLLAAYEELDRQPVQGENVMGSKAEIMKVLDTLNGAFERLLDNLFQDTTIDISSDISVLETLLAQDGLTGNDFSKRR